VEQELAAGLGERQIAELVENYEVHPGQVIGESSLTAIAGLGFKPVDEIDRVVEPAAGAGLGSEGRSRMAVPSSFRSATACNNTLFDRVV
jgi:hypothetical protein